MTKLLWNKSKLFYLIAWKIFSHWINVMLCRWLYKEATIKSTEVPEDDTESLIVEVVMTSAAYAKFVSAFKKK